MFPDSKIAENFSCKRTKCTDIVKQSLAPEFSDKVIDRCRNQPFTILCDESNDRGSDKYFAVLVRIFEDDRNTVATRFLDMPVVNIGTGHNLFESLNTLLRY